MKIILIAGLIVLATLSVCEAKVYVALSKQDGSPSGMVDINEKNVGDWSKKFIMIEADESYRGLQSYEIKYEDQKLRKATQAEINAYLNAQTAEQATKKKEDTLSTLGITAHDIDKVKNLPGVDVNG